MMLVYVRILNESPPEAFVLSGPEATVGELLERVRSTGACGGRHVVLLIDGAADSARLTELGVSDGDLVTVQASGEPRAISADGAVHEIDVDALRVEPPRGSKRLSEYEDVTQLLQWHPPFHINGDRPSHQVWSDDSTALRCSDWAAFRSPDKLYYRTYTGRQAKAERAVSTAFQFAEESDQLAQADGEHVALMRDLVGVLQYPDWGLCVVHQHTTRFALSSWIAGATEFMMFDELRHAQLYGRLALAYGEHYDGFDDPRHQWMDDERFQPTRRLTEELLAVLDWGKAIIIAGIVVEPLLTSVVHSLLTSGSVRSGDSLTPFVCQSIAEDKARHRDSASAFLQMVTADPLHGADNRAQIDAWMTDWLSRAVTAATTLAAGDPDALAALDSASARAREQLDFADAPAEGLAGTSVGAGA
jgi:hypothetical protein